MLGPRWVPSRPFGTYLAGKFRLIDDDSASLVNETATCPEQVVVDGVCFAFCVGLLVFDCFCCLCFAFCACFFFFFLVFLIVFVLC